MKKPLYPPIIVALGDICRIGPIGLDIEEGGEEMSISTACDFFIQWHLTERCNLRCRHCYQTGEKSDEMSLPEMKEFIGEVSDMLDAWADAYGIDFARSFSITGGEPFLHQDLFEILEETRRRGFDVSLLTNGILIDEERARLLAWLGVSGVQVSVEGPENIHDAIRGKGSYAASLRGVGCLLDEGIRVTLNVTLSDVNAGYLSEMVDLASSLGVQRLGFSRLVPSGRGLEMLDRMLMTDRLKELYGTVFSLTAKGIEIVTGDPVASQFTSSIGNGEDGPIPLGGCAAGVSGLTVLPDGTITPCRRLPIPIGNVRKDSLREVWINSNVLTSLRDKSKYKGKCGRCRRWSACRGCRAIAYACSQSKGGDDFLAEDPQCFIADA